MMLFFQTKNIFIRVMLVIAAIADFIVVGLTVSRNGQTCICLMMGMVAGIVALNHLCGKAAWKRVAVFFVVCVFGAVLLYQLYEPARYGLWRIYQSNEVVEGREMNTSNNVIAMKESLNKIIDDSGANETGVVVVEDIYKADNREYLNSGRKEIFWSALKSLQLEPKRLLIGSGYYHVMDISHTLIKEQAKHFHNTFLQVVNEFGLIGLTLVIWFYLRIAICSIRLIFQMDEKVSIADKMFVLLPISLMFYYMLEVGIFKIVDRADFRNTFFFFICGMFVGLVREKCRQETA